MRSKDIGIKADENKVSYGTGSKIMMYYKNDVGAESNMKTSTSFL